MDFSFIHITDHHLPETETALTHGFSPVYAFRAVMRHIAEHVARQADFIVSTGDLVEPTTDAAYQNLCKVLNLRAVSVAPGPQLVSLEGLNEFPMYFLPGNHDERESFARYLFPRSPPAGSANYVFQHKGVQFITVDWGAQSKAIASPEMLEHLTSALKSDLPSVLLMHHHVIPIGSCWLDNFIADEVEKFWDIVTNHNVLGIFSGHVHTTYEKQVDGIPVYGLRSTAFPFALQDDPLLTLQPPHYRLVTVHDSILTTRIYEVPL